MSDLIVGLAGVIAGWGLSQATEIIKAKCHNQNLRYMLTEEIKDIHSQFGTLIDPLKKVKSSFYRSNSRYFSSFSYIHTPFLHEKYIEVAYLLNENQRYNIRRLMDEIKFFNSTIEWFSSYDSEQYDKETTEFKLYLLLQTALKCNAILKECIKTQGHEKIDIHHESMQEVEKVLADFR